MAHALAAVVVLLLALHPAPARAFLTAGKTTGTEFTLLPEFVAGELVWNLTIETATGTSNDLGGQLSIDGAVSFTPNPLICDPLLRDVICAVVPATDLSGEPGYTSTLDDNLFLIIAVVSAGVLNGGTGNPLTLGSVTPTPLVFAPRLTLEGLDVLNGATFPNPTGFAEPVAFVNFLIPEPSPAGLLGLALSSMILLRNYSSSGLRCARRGGARPVTNSEARRV
jgi:hypothetical protein